MQNFDINDLKVAKPCPVGWENMSGDDRTRFCSLCELNVYNISEMTAAEVRSLIGKSGGRVCGRIYKRADGTVLTRDCPVGLSKYRKRVAKYSGAVLGAILGLFSAGFAQADQKKSERAPDSAAVKAAKKPVPDGYAMLQGTVMDVHGAVVPGVRVVITSNNEKKEKNIVITNNEGIYRAAIPAASSFDIEVKVPGFKSFENKDLSFDNGKDRSVDIILQIDESFIVGLLAITETPLEVKDASVTNTIQKRKLEKLPF
ncbi:MAG TPA: carboxypeptidase-like regulatory domain-containing protein [Pyrinomonadaceae bacterium]|jgi:hypothetical protein|nr:carboxypeptidase-like regulatory domain-containing protein [Pyrinomonadaceae bacterium]